MSSSRQMSIQERIRAMNQTIERVVEQDDPNIPYEDATVSTMTMSIKEYEEDSDDDDDSDDLSKGRRASVVDMWRKREAASSSAEKPKPAAARKWGQPSSKQRIIKEEEEEKKESPPESPPRKNVPVSVVDMIKQRSASAAVVSKPSPKVEQQPKLKKDLLIVDDDKRRPTPKARTSASKIWEKRGLASPKVQITDAEEEEQAATPRRGPVVHHNNNLSSPPRQKSQSHQLRHKNKEDEQEEGQQQRVADEAASSATNAMSNASSAAALWRQRRNAAKRVAAAKKSSPSWLANTTPTAPKKTSAQVEDQQEEADDADDWLGTPPASAEQQPKPSSYSSARSEVSSASSSAAMRWREQRAVAKSSNKDECKQSSAKSDVGVGTVSAWKQRSSWSQRNSPSSPSARSWNKPSPRGGATQQGTPVQPVKTSEPVVPVEWDACDDDEEGSTSQRQSAAAFWSKQITPNAASKKKPTWKTPKKDTTPSWVKQRKNDNDEEEESRSVSGTAATTPSWVNKTSPQVNNDKPPGRSSLGVNNSTASSSTKPEWMNKLKKSSPREVPKAGNNSSSKPAWMNPGLRRLTPTPKGPEGGSERNDISANQERKNIEQQQPESPSKRRNPNWKNISIDISSKETIDSHPPITGQSTEDTRPETKSFESSPLNSRNTIESDVDGADVVALDVAAEDDTASAAAADLLVQQSNTGDDGAVEDAVEEENKDKARIIRPTAISRAHYGFGIEKPSIEEGNGDCEESHDDKDEPENASDSRDVLSDATPVQSSAAEENAELKSSDAADDEIKSQESHIEEEEPTMSPSPSSAFKTFDQTTVSTTPKRSQENPVEFNQTTDNIANDFDPKRASYFSPSSEAASVASSSKLAAAKGSSSSQAESFDPFISSPSSEEVSQTRSASSFGGESRSLNGPSGESEEFPRDESTSNATKDTYLPSNLATGGFVDDFDTSRVSFFSPQSSNASSDVSSSKTTSGMKSKNKKIETFDPFVSESSSEETSYQSSFNPFEPSREGQPLEWPEPVSAPAPAVVQKPKQETAKTAKKLDSTVPKKENVETKTTPLSLRQRAQLWKRRHLRKTPNRKKLAKEADNKVVKDQQQPTDQTPLKSNTQQPPVASTNEVEVAMQYATPSRTIPVQETEGSEQRLGARSINSLFRDEDRKRSENQEVDSRTISSNYSRESTASINNSKRSAKLEGGSDCDEDSVFETVADPDSSAVRVSKAEEVTPDRNVGSDVQRYDMKDEDDQVKLEGSFSQDSVPLNLNTSSSVTTQSSIGLQSNRAGPNVTETSSPTKEKKEVVSVTDQLNSGLRNFQRIGCGDTTAIDADDFVNAYLPAALTPVSPERGPAPSPRRTPRKPSSSNHEEQIVETAEPEGSSPVVPSVPPSPAKVTAITTSDDIAKEDNGTPERKVLTSPASTTGLASRASRALAERRNRRGTPLGRNSSERIDNDQTTEKETEGSCEIPAKTQPPPPPPATRGNIAKSSLQNSLTRQKQGQATIDRATFVNRYQNSDRYMNDEQSQNSSRGGTVSAQSFGSEFSDGAFSTDAESTGIMMTRSTSGFSQSTGADTGAITMDSSYQEENPLTLSGIKDAYHSMSVSNLANDLRKEMQATFDGMKGFTNGFSFNFPGDTSFRNNSSSRKSIGSIQSWRSIETAEEEVAIEVEYIGTREDSFEEIEEYELEKSKQKIKAVSPAGQSSYETKL